MYLEKIIFIFPLLYFTWASEYEKEAEEVTKYIPCYIRKSPCSRYEDIWATDGKKCFKFCNRCSFDDENLIRDTKVQKLRVVSIQLCANMCPIACTKEYKPVCGVENRVYRTFANYCTMKFYNCNNRTKFVKLRNGPCGSQKQPKDLDGEILENNISS